MPTLDPAAVERVLADEFSRQGLLLSRFVLVSEQVDPEGGRSLNVAASEEIRTWDIAGMLRCATVSVDTQMADEWTADD